MTDNATPWRLHLVDSTAIIGSDGECIAKVEGDYKQDWQRMEANAALIVRAVNAHDDLVRALRVARQQVITLHPSGDNRGDSLDMRDTVQSSVLDVIDAALAKAGAP